MLFETFATVGKRGRKRREKEKKRKGKGKEKEEKREGIEKREMRGQRREKENGGEIWVAKRKRDMDGERGIERIERGKREE